MVRQLQWLRAGPLARDGADEMTMGVDGIWLASLMLWCWAHGNYWDLSVLFGCSVDSEVEEYRPNTQLVL